MYWRRRSSTAIGRSFWLASRRCVCLPSINSRRVSEEGGLISYGPRLLQVYGETLARQIVVLFRGAKPADVPVEQPSKFELVINLKTAKSLGIAIPTTMLDRADKVIE